MRIACFGSSLVSAYWNGAATYYRGLLKALARQGHQVLFCEPDAFGRQEHRDMPDPDWAEVLVFAPDPIGMERALCHARRADVVVKFSGVGVLDAELEREVLTQRRPGQIVVYWDVDAPATLEGLEADPQAPLCSLIPRYDAVLTYGGGEAVVESYERMGAAVCVPIYNALDPETHHPVAPDARFRADLAFLGNRLPDRERRVEQFFLEAAGRLPSRSFLLGGSGWADKNMPKNVIYAGHVYTRDHNAFNATPLAVLNINRESMVRFGSSPPTRIFEAAGAGACVISDAWAGMEKFLEPETEVLLVQDGSELADRLRRLDAETAARIGAAARRRLLAEHTYALRALEVEKVLHLGTPLRRAM